jgi:Na+-transporting NADH:ubiquinone oxidoreductase subunit NqrB
MMKQRLYNFCADARHFQIFTLGSLLCFLVMWSDFAPSIEIIALTITTALWVQFGFSNYLGIKHDYRSPLITSLSLCLLFRAAEIWFFPLAALIAIGSKFLIRYDGKHLFNPANIGIVALLILFPHHAWISPGQWGSDALLVFALLCLSFLVLFRVNKRDVVLFFIGSYAALTFIRALWLGDPLEIPFHQLQNGALLIFTFFMISDPKTTPDHKWGRFLFALSIAVIGFIMLFQFQVREGLFYALALVCMVTPFIDKALPARKFEWRTT